MKLYMHHNEKSFIRILKEDHALILPRFWPTKQQLIGENVNSYNLREIWDWTVKLRHTFILRTN